MKQQEQSMVDWTELERLYAPTIIPDENRRMARAEFEEYMHDAFPAILSERKAMLAKLEAAQRCVEELRNIATAKRHNKLHFESDTDFVDWARNRANAALAAFDKETE